MTRRQWTDLALALAELRDELEAHAGRARNDNTRRAHLERVIGVDLATRVICRVLRRHTARFDGRRFMRAYVTAAK